MKAPADKPREAFSKNSRTDPNGASWLYPVVYGATTCLEAWNTYLAGSPTGSRGIRPTFFSFNHLPLGAVAEWVWEAVAGVTPDEEDPGFRNVIIFPHPGAGLTNAYAAFNSIHGQIVSTWTNNPSSSTYNITLSIPANTTASLYLPSADLSSITESGAAATNATGVLYYSTNSVLGFTNGATMFKLGSGTYRFSTSGVQF